MTVDDTNKLFYHRVGWYNEQKIPKDVCLMTFPGSGEDEKTLKDLGYNYKKSNESCAQAFSLAERRLKHYGPIFIPEIGVLLLFLLYILF